MKLARKSWLKIGSLILHVCRLFSWVVELKSQVVLVEAAIAWSVRGMSSAA